MERKLLEVRIGEHSFDEGSKSIEYICERFDLPDPGCVKTRFLETVEKNRKVLEEIASENGFELKPFQLDHLSRLLVKKRGMLAHEQGFGKTIQLMCLAEATVRLGANDQALFVIPQDLIPQWRAEARKFFGRAMEVIRTPAQARGVARRVKAGESGWWLTYYEALGVVGRRKEVLPERPLEPKDALRERLAAYKRRKKGLPPSEGRDPFSGPATTKFACPKCRADTRSGWSGEVCSSCGFTMRSIYVKSAYSHLTTAFERGVKCVDEVSEMRGDDSLRSKA
ncbi:MAG: DEAD/DEAH box helicase family protein, partial [Rubrobacteraceae bacterium]